jgi:hypothetical protein
VYNDCFFGKGFSFFKSLQLVLSTSLTLLELLLEETIVLGLTDSALDFVTFDACDIGTIG